MAAKWHLREMGILNDLLRRVQTFNDGLTGGEYMAEIITEYDYQILDMNTETQLYEQGITATGISIMDYAPYSPVTIEIKQAAGQPYDRVTLRDTGDFHRSFFLQIDNEKFTFNAEDWKTRDLLRLYGDEIMGLTPENVQLLERTIILPELMTKAQQTLF